MHKIYGQEFSGLSIKIFGVHCFVAFYSDQGKIPHFNLSLSLSFSISAFFFLIPISNISNFAYSGKVMEWKTFLELTSHVYICFLTF